MSERDELSVTLDTPLARNELGLATRSSVPVNLFTVYFVLDLLNVSFRLGDSARNS
jgi:hypothetical protein